MPPLSQQFEEALNYFQAGNLHQAEVLFRQILQVDQRHVDALHQLGLIAYQVGRNDLAVNYIQQALRFRPAFPAAHNNLGIALRNQGRLDEAINGFQQALGLQPDFVEAYNNLGLTLQDQGKLDEAINTFQQVLRLKPGVAVVYNNLGNAQRAQGKIDDAIGNLQQALRLKPDYAVAYNNLGNALQDQGKTEEAITNYQCALRLRPDYAEAFTNVGMALRDQGKLADAIANCQQALRLKPQYAEAHNNLGIALQDQGKLAEAITSYQQALRLKPDYPEAYSNLGNALKDLGNFEEAMTSYGQALRLKPDYAEARFNRSMQLLHLGNFAEGWAEYEWRWRSRSFLGKGFSRPWLSHQAWDGTPLEGRTILLQAEQGLGDTIQFVRYASLLKQTGAGKVLLVCQPGLLRLMGRCQDVDQVCSGPPFPAFDVGASLLSLPRLLGTTSLERIPAKVPYFDCDIDLVERWESRLASLGARRPWLRIGISWQGSAANKGDRWRSVRLEQFASLAQDPRVRLVSLQKGLGSEQMEKIPGLAIDPGPEQVDMADTAAIIRCLDLVISVDTLVAHLAGALGIPVWVPLAKVPDWRWLLHREDSPWYPSMRLFRQTERGRWDDVFHRIKIALDAHLFHQTLQLKPDNAEAYNMQGIALQSQGKLEEAIKSFRQALQLNPDYSEAYGNLGLALKDVGNLEEAILNFEMVVRLKPENAEGYNNLGIALKDHGLVDKAIVNFQQALRLKPDHAEAHFNRSLQLLLLGNYAEGWAEYQWRWRSRIFLARSSSRQPSSQRNWDGSPLQGRTILLHAEQGLGDTIQFARYASLLKKQGAGKVLLECSTDLLRLMRRCQGIDQVFSGTTFPAFDVSAFLLSLPTLMGTTSVDLIPGNVPYLDCDPELVDRWELRLASLDARRPSLRVGIVWQGNPGHSRDRWRSVGLEHFAPLVENVGVRLVSLQKGPGSEQLEKMPGLALDTGAEFTDLADTAAVIRCLDLVISVDTAVAHLAGALGTPVWVLLGKVPDWRWLLHREDCPWYPTMRLFRQFDQGRWGDVFLRIKNALPLQQ